MWVFDRVHIYTGIRGAIAESHFDGSRNFAASFGGLRRWILAHPNQCESLYLYPNGHPSKRHSEIDWSKPDYESHPNFANAQANEIILKPGEVLYLPTYWFHYIVSLNINYQCNTRSGTTYEYRESITKCGY
jgi:ribosomal protein L16 Arg81 hydroxylase